MTMAHITISLPIEGEDTATNPDVVAALNALADVMLVQAEDGLWTLGSPESETTAICEDGVERPVESEYLRGIGSGMAYAVRIEGANPSLDLRAALDQRILSAVKGWDDEEFLCAFGFERGEA